MALLKLFLKKKAAKKKGKKCLPAALQRRRGAVGSTQMAGPGGNKTLSDGEGWTGGHFLRVEATEQKAGSSLCSLRWFVWLGGLWGLGESRDNDTSSVTKLGLSHKSVAYEKVQ
jgi:hypothetical protein